MSVSIIFLFVDYTEELPKQTNKPPNILFLMTRLLFQKILLAWGCKVSFGRLEEFGPLPKGKPPKNQLNKLKVNPNYCIFIKNVYEVLPYKMPYCFLKFN